MSHKVQPARYSLRPNPTVFDLRINNNRFGLQRRTIDRDTESRSNRAPKVNKRKLLLVPIKNSVVKILGKATVQIKEAVMADPKWNWKLPQRTLENRSRKPPSIVYDASKPAYFMNLDEECIFEIFNHLSLNDFCATAEVCSQLKFAAQKYFDVMYTAVNMSWLADDDSGTFTLLQAKRMLYHFGHLISTLIVNTERLDPNDSKEKLLTLVEKYCSGVLFWNAKN